MTGPIPPLPDRVRPRFIWVALVLIMVLLAGYKALLWGWK